MIKEIFAPHSHDAADSVDDTLESTAAGIRTVKISLLVLGLTALIQIVIVVMSGSVALAADTIHNFADALTAVPLWIAFALGAKPATRRYTYGFGRVEDLAGSFVVAMITMSAIIAGYEAIARLIHPQQIEHVGWVALAGLVGFIGNEWVALYRIRVGHRIGSAALIADGLHARTDGFTSLAVLCSAGGVALGFPLADPIVGLLITAAILAVLRTAARDVLLVALRSADEQPFSDKQLDMMAAFADQAALAWRLATAQRQMREVEILTDRDRIARDLHDHVIQRLFAVGLTLQGAAPRARVPAVRESIYSSIDDLQEIIQEIRSAIFDLHAGPSRATGLRHRLDKVIDQLAIPALHTTVQYTGPLSVVDTVLANHAEAVLREAVSNAVRHANATSLAINVSVEDDVRVEVVDDGVGISGDITESGLRNLRQRADDAGGEFTVENMPTGGTLLRWSAPLR